MLFVLIVLSAGIGSMLVRAQVANDLDALKQQVQQLDQAGKYSEALAHQRRLASEIENAETASTGGPGEKTVDALAAVAWYALRARDFKQALVTSNRAHSLAPDNLHIETNRAHALLLLGRVREAQSIYLSHKGKPISLDSDEMWEDVIAGDIKTLRAGGINHAAFQSIIKALGGSTESNAGLNDLIRRIQELYNVGRYAEAVPFAEKAIELTRKQRGENRTEFAIAISWLAYLFEAQGHYAEAEPLYKRSLEIREKILGPNHLDVAKDLNNIAALYRDEGRYAEAEPLFKRALSITEKALGPEAIDVALNNLATLYSNQGRYAEAEPLYKRAIAIGEKTLGPDHPTIANRLDNLARLYDDQGRYPEAEPLFKRALAIDEKALGPDHPDVGRDLNNLAILYHRQGRYREAESLYKRSLANAEKALGADHPDVGTRLNNLATWYQDQGRYAEAEPLLKRALTIDEKAFGPDHPVVGLHINNLASVYQDQGRYSEAEPLYKRSLAIAEKALGPDHPEVATRLNNLAELNRTQAHYAEAEPLFKRALAIDERVLGPEHASVAIDLKNLARLYHDQGRYTEAEPFLKRALAIDEKALGPEHPSVSREISALAELYHDQHRYAEAESLMKRSREIDEKALGPDHPDVGRDLADLALIYNAQGRYADAEPLMQRALEIAQTAHGPDHPTVAIALNNLALLYHAEGRDVEAESAYKRALAIGEKTLGSDHPDLGSRLYNLASMYQDQGRYAEAEPLYTRALAIDEKGLGPDHPDVSSDLNNIASLYFSQRDWERAANYWRSSTDVIIRRTVRGTRVVGEAVTGKRRSETGQASSQFRGLIKAVNHLALDRGNDAGLQREMFQMAQWAQSSEAAESLIQMSARGVKGDSTLATQVRERQDLVAEWQKRDEVRIAAAAQPPNNRDANAEAANVARLAAIDARIADIDKRLASDFPEYAALASPVPMSVDDVQKDLGADEALLLFLDTLEWKPAPEETFVWVITRTDARWIRSDLGTPALTREVSALRCGLDYEGAWIARDSHCSDVLHVSYTRADHDMFGKPLPFDLGRAHTLYKALFGQIEDLIRDKRLLIVPSGPLTQLPFQVLVTDVPKVALPSSVADYRDVAWLTRKHTITVLPAVSSLRALRELAKESHASEAYVGFGNPLLDGDPARFRDDAMSAKLAREARCPQPQGHVASLSNRGATRTGVRSNGGLADVADVRTWAPLPETADELCDVAQNLGVDPVTHLYIGSKATEGEIKLLSNAGTLAKYKVVHFATHGAVAGELSGTSEPGLILTPPDTASEIDDGYLSASEIAALKLDADWVILSACNTAAGDTKGAEALSGLARAFFYAGARSLLVSHWEVASQPTVKLITIAIAELKADPKIGRAEALRRSMLSLITTGKDYEAHPAFWAPFVLVGEGGAAS
jgi:tetratricopeptide (TPR) repeat protein/CHAT domain-containing protein